MADFKVRSVELNLRGLNRLMASNSVQAEVDRVGQSMAANAGRGFEYRSRRHKWTARGFVGTADAEGAKRQSDEAVLERVLGSR